MAVVEDRFERTYGRFRKMVEKMLSGMRQRVTN